MPTETSQEEKLTKSEENVASGNEKKDTKKSSKKTAAGEDVIKYAEENATEKKAAPKSTGNYTPPPSIEGIDGLTGKKITVAIDDIKMLSRTIYVENMHVQTPNIYEVQYRVGGDFRQVLLRVDEATFNQLAAMPKFTKKKNVHYTYVSDFLQNDPNRAALLERTYHSYDPAWPTQEEILRQDKERARYVGIPLTTELEKKLFPDFKDEAKKAAAEAAAEDKKIAKQQKDKGGPALQESEVEESNNQ